METALTGTTDLSASMLYIHVTCCETKKEDDPCTTQ